MRGGGNPRGDRLATLAAVHAQDEFEGAVVGLGLARAHGQTIGGAELSLTARGLHGLMGPQGAAWG